MHFYSLRLRHPASNRISRNDNAQRILLKRLADWSNDFVSLLSIDVSFVSDTKFAQALYVRQVYRRAGCAHEGHEDLGCARTCLGAHTLTG